MAASTVEVYPNESLGKEMDLINGMQLGTVDMTITGESLQNWAPMAALLAVPYAYKTIDQMDAVASGDDRRQDQGRDHRQGQDPPDRLLPPRPARPDLQPPDQVARRPQRPEDARAQRAAVR